MRGKNTSVLFIILANLVLMLHAIVPHHYHNNNLCFDLVAEEVHTDEQDVCEVPENDHDHEKEKDKDHCFVLDIVALSSGDIKQNVRIAFNAGVSHLDFHYVSLLNQNKDLDVKPYLYKKNLPQNHNSKYLSLASRAIGLRAPPQVS